MDADDRAALWAAEVEALSYTFDDGTCTVDRAAPPRAAFRVETTFLGVTLTADCAPSYPADPPSLTLTDVRGLGDARQAALLAHLRAVAADAAGDCALALLADATAAALAAAPAPDGDCPLCLEPLTMVAADDDDTDATSAPRLVRLACWHALHAGCAGGWWLAVGGGAATADAAAITCPTCRDVAGPLPPGARAKLDALAATAAAGACAAAAADETLRHGGPAAWGLTADAAAALAAHSAAVAAGLQAQAAAGGLVSERVAVTIDELATAMAETAVAPPDPPSTTAGGNGGSAGDRTASKPRGGRRCRGRGRGRGRGAQRPP